jgi:hypothetical protein
MDCAYPAVRTMFTMKAMLMWTIHDFPTYGLVSGCITKGYEACPIFGPHELISSGQRQRGSISRHPRALKKNVFTPGYRKWLSQHHTYKHMQTAFEAGCEFCEKPSEV